jgi:hypothetical protein
MLAFVNAVGATIPPVFVFPRVRQNSALSTDGPVGCLGLVHESGWMTADNFLLSLIHFQSHVGSTKQRPVLLLMDNHASHVDFRVIEYAKENGIVLLTFPPHCSHALQPCDVSVFGPFKRALRSSHNDWIQMNPGKRISIKEVAGLCKGPFLSKLTAENIIPGFQSTGIWPFNRTAIPTSKFAPSIVTDRPGILVIYIYFDIINLNVSLLYIF